MPVHNAADYVAAAVTSILQQTLTDFEFLVLDDGSQDRSYAILTALAQQDTRLRVSRSPNQGVSRARNQLLAQAQGEFIAVMDADDQALPERLAEQVDFLQRHPQVVCVGGSHELIDQRGRFLTCLALPTQNDEIQRLALAGHGSICHPCAMVRRAAMVQVQGYDPSLRSAHDLDLWLKLGELGELANLPQPVLRYRLHTQSVSAQNHLAQREEARIACERAWQRRGIQGRFEATKPWRPGPTGPSRYPFMLQYGWWAYNSRHYQTALVYAGKAIAALPHGLQGWKLLACALVKRQPVSEPG